MERLLLRFCWRPWWTLLVLALLSGVAFTQLSGVRVHIGADELLVRGDPDFVYFEEIQRRFGEARVALLYLEDAAPLAPERLKLLQPIVNQIEALPFVTRVDSLFSVPHVQTVKGFLSKDPYLKMLPATLADARQLQKTALENPFLRSVLLSPDGRVMALAIVLSDAIHADDETLTNELNLLIEPLGVVYEQAFVIGYPQVRVEIAERLAAEQGRLLPWAVGALLIALFLSLRQAVDVVIPLITAGLSILWTLGLMGATGIPLNIVTSMVPILLIIIGSTEDIHLLAEFRDAQRHCGSTEEAIGTMARRMGRTVLLTFLTTFFGFLSVGLGGVELLRQFGLVAAAGLAFNFLITISLIPAVLRLIGHRHMDGRCPFLDRSQDGPAWIYCQWLRRNRVAVLSIAAAVAVVAAIGIPRITINDNPVETLPADSQSRAQFEAVNRHLAGLESLSIVLESGISDTFLKVRYQEELVRLQEFIQATGKAGSTTSFADYLALLNGAFLEYDEPLMPEVDAEVDELMIFLDYDHVRSYVSDDYTTARVLVRHRLADIDQIKDFVAQIQQYLDEQLDPGLKARITGPSVLSLSSTKAMLRGQLLSIGLLVVSIVLLMSVLFADWRVGLLAIVPNVFPVLVLFGAMGYFGIPLNIGTTMAAAIAIGIAVDDTMHMMLRYNKQLKRFQDFPQAMHATIQSEALPVIATSLALIAGFLVFTLSEFQPVVQFGVLSAIAIVAALVADFFVLPLALASVRVVTLVDLLTVPWVKEVVAHSNLFRGMRPWQIRRFIVSSNMREIAAEQILYEAGGTSDSMFLVLEGEMQAQVAADDGYRVVESFIPGETVGEVALLAREPRHARVVAVRDSRVLVISRDHIRNALRRSPFLSSRLFYNLSREVSARVLRMIDRAAEAPVNKGE